MFMYYSATIFFCFKFTNGFLLNVSSATTEPPSPSGITSEEFYFQDKILQYQFIIPGTKYCGTGNRSTGPNDLGNLEQVDGCCRDHDNCPDNIPAGKYKHGLHNNAEFTKSHCSCDENFHHCLRDVGSVPARLVGALYFTIFHINCFKKEYPVIDCTRTKFRRCLEYKLNFTATPVYQWFDNPFWRYWVDRFPSEMMNVSSTTPISIINATEIYSQLNITTMVNQIAHNNITLESGTSTSFNFGGYMQSLYDSILYYLHKWTSFTIRNIPEESTTVIDENYTNEVDK